MPLPVVQRCKVVRHALCLNKRGFFVFLVAEVLCACMNDVGVMQLTYSHDSFVTLLPHLCLKLGNVIGNCNYPSMY